MITGMINNFAKIVVAGFFLSLCLTTPANARGLLAGALKDIGIISEQTREDLDKAHAEIKNAVPAYKALEEQSSETVRNAVNIITTGQKEAESKPESFVSFVSSIKDAEEKLNVLQDKVKKFASDSSKIEDERDNFRKGLIASIAGNIIAFLGILAKVPTMWLDRRLKLLEIQEKEMALKANGVPATGSKLKCNTVPTATVLECEGAG